MKIGFPLLLLSLTGSALAADAPSSRPPPPTEPARSPFVFSLLPKSFQQHPTLDYHVITEMTPAGRKLPEPTPERPTYYLAQPGKFTQAGNNTPGNEHPPSQADLTRAMQNALAASGYRAAEPKSPLPSIVVVFNYGSFARFSTDAYDFQQMLEVEQAMQSSDPNAAPPAAFLPSGGDRDPDALLPMVLSNKDDRADVLKRAELIGGEKFAGELAQALNDEAIYRQGNSGTGLGPQDLNSPFHRFMNANSTTMNLVEESFSSCYFVIASAYDYVAMRKGRKVLLWRTKMTVNSTGISMSESMPSLIASAGPYFGRDMTEPVTLSRRLMREGKVEMGTPRVVDEPAPPAAGASGTSGKP